LHGKFAEMLAELSRREKTANIKPDPDLDIFMKVRQYFFFFFFDKGEQAMPLSSKR
jgi:hypothetical protein